MTIYFDTKVEFLDLDAVSTISCWHPNEALFAVASYSQDRGGSVTIFADTGEPQRDVTYPVHPLSQATSMAWHPEKVLLATGWENGDIHVWFAGHREFASVNGPHRSAIVLLEFSEQGGRMVTADAMGLLTGWRCDGQYQFLTMFSHDLRDAFLLITFRRTIESEVRDEMANLAKAAVAGDENALDTLTNWRPRTAARNLTHSSVKDNHCFYACTQTGVIYYINQAGTCTEVLKSNTVPPIVQMLWHPKKDAVVCLMEDMTVTLYLVETTGILTELDRIKLSGRAIGKNGAICWAGNSLAILTGEFTVRIWDIEKSDNYLLKMDLPSINGTLGSSDTHATTNTTANTFYGGQDSVESSTSLSNGIPGYLQRKQKYSAPLLNEIFTCIAYSVSSQTLCAGSSQGNLYTWRRTIGSGAINTNTPEDNWQLTNISSVRGAVKHCEWGFEELSKPCILVNCISNVYVLKEHPLLAYHTRDLWAVQLNAKSISLSHKTGRHCVIHTDFAVTALALNNLNLIVSSGRSISAYSIQKVEKIEDYTSDKSDEHNVVNSNRDSNSNGNGNNNDNGNDMGSGSASAGASASASGNADNTMASKESSEPVVAPLIVKLMQTFHAECLALSIQNQNVFCLTNNDVMVYSIGGVVLNKIQANDTEGKIIGMDLTSCYLTIFTLNGFLKTYDVSRHNPRILFPSKSGYEMFDDFGEFILVKCNSVGSHLAIVVANQNFVPKAVLYCWDFERNNLMEYSLCHKQMDSKSSLPVNIFWDTDESRLMAIEVRSMLQQKDQHQQKVKSGQQQQQQHQSESSASKSKTMSRYIESQVLVMFYSDASTLRVLESRTLGTGEQLINLCVPNVLTLNINCIKETPLQDFTDLQQCDANTRKLVLNFSLHASEGNMDMAYRCIRSIQSKAIWTNLAKMCVKTNRLDVAKVCMGHLEMTRSVRALRQAIEDDDLEQEAKLALLACELGKVDEALKLYQNCGRYDLYSRLLQASGHIDEALKVAVTDDRIHLKNTYYCKAQLLKESGDIKGALEYFEKTQNPVQNITQLLLEHPLIMKRYMQNTNDPKMLKWWGQYVESSGDMDTALAIYQKAEDWFSQVKILCYLGKISKADVIARQSGDRAACYHLARHYENVGKFQEAIMFYTRAHTFSNAIRICKENDFQDELWTVASSSRSRDKAIAAAYFEECGDFKRAVELYHRAGMLHKALEMAFDSEQPEILEIIATELSVESDTELINRCADFFLSIEQHQKAVQLLAKTKHLQRSLRICAEKGVPITEDLAEMLTPSKLEFDEPTRVTILTQLGELLQEQGDYATATKKFTQAGNKVRAMQSLLKSGNTDKIIFFANMSRQREVYVMAANYLQALNWQDDANILKHIITFYSKGQAYDSLANFYAICAQIAIEQFDYEKALKEMNEAAKCLEKIGHSPQALNNLQRTIADVKNILDLQQSLRNGENQAVINGCRAMLLKPEAPPIRHSHILALLVRALVYTKQYNEAGRMLKELAIKDQFWSENELVDKGIVQKIAYECNLDFDIIWNSGCQQQTLVSDDNDTYQETDDDIREELHLK